MSLIVRAGEWDTETTHELFPHSDHRIREVVIHKGFNSGGLQNDIALLFLEEPVIIAHHVNTICLPHQDASFDHSRCFATGWGKDSFGKGGKYQAILRKVELPIVPFELCAEIMKSTRLGARFKLHESFICAGGAFEKGKVLRTIN